MQMTTHVLQIALISGGIILLFLLLLLRFIRGLLNVCTPNEMLIFSGRSYRMPDGASRGYRVLFGGRGLRLPFVETVQKMSLNTIVVPIHIRGAYSKGGIPLDVDAIANIKISSAPNEVSNAIERFLGHDISEIRRVGKETLEGHLRGVLATLTPEEVNEDRLKFADSLTHESAEDLTKLGLHLDTLKILHVADEVEYLNSIGRSAIATVIKNAEIAESDFKREAELAEADNSARGNVSKANAEASIAQMRNQLRKIQADLEAKVKAEEERTTTIAREARAKAEQELQQLRSQMEAIRLQADVVLPAEARKSANEFQAKGEAAKIREKGKALSLALDNLSRAWQTAGPKALQYTLIQNIENILASAGEATRKLHVQHMNVVDSGDSSSLSNYTNTYITILQQTLKALEHTTGIDVTNILNNQS